VTPPLADQSVSPFAYVNNMPGVLTDPSGRHPCDTSELVVQNPFLIQACMNHSHGDPPIGAIIKSPWTNCKQGIEDYGDPARDIVACLYNNTPLPIISEGIDELTTPGCDPKWALVKIFGGEALWAIGIAGPKVVPKVGRRGGPTGGKFSPPAAIDGVLSGLAPGRSANVWVVSSDAELRAIYKQLAHGGHPVTWSRYKGTVVRRSDGTEIGIRAESRSGGATIDIRVAGQPQRRIHIRS
jgi:hypothetical protein